MSERSRIREEMRRRRKARQNNQFIVLGIVGLVIIAVVLLLVFQSKNPPAASQPTAAPAQPTVAQNIPPAPTVMQLQYSAVPAMQIDTSKQYFATVKLVKGGEFVIQLFPDKAPVTVNSFVFLAKQGYFNGTTFHRVLKDFMAQGGDPTGLGTGGPGYTLPDEFTNGLTFDKGGVVAMANTGQANSGGSQFFITFGPQTYLNGNYTIFGQVISGMDVVNTITLRDPQTNPTFTGDAIQSIAISEK